MKTETLTKTDNDRIFVERDEPLSTALIQEKLSVLEAALQTEDDDAIRVAMKQVVPTYHSPEEVNGKAIAEAKFIEDTATGAAVPVAGVNGVSIVWKTYCGKIGSDSSGKKKYQF